MRHLYRWLGSVWWCIAHDRYFEDGDVCPDSEPRDRARA